jgi:nucleotide-binding universal stress UspA family protein
MKTILLPTDFSNNSMNAIDYAMGLFKNVSCNFYIINVQKASSFISDDMIVVSASATIYQTIVETAKKSIDNMITKIKHKYHNDKHVFHSIVDYDNFIDSINQASEINHIDLIVMGTKGASGLEKVIFGSNTVRVMQRCNTPVLAIPDGCKFTDLDVVAFTTSYKSLYHESDLKPLINLTNKHHSKLCVLHVANEDDLTSEIDKDIDFFNDNFNAVSYEYIEAVDENIFKTIHEYVIKNNIKMVALVSKKHSFLERLFTRHTIETIAFHIDIPFMVMHDSSGILNEK